MASVTASTRNRIPAEVQEWRRGLGFASLRARIFAVNLVAVIVLAIMLLYLDTVRARLLGDRSVSLAAQAETIAGFEGGMHPEEKVPLLEGRSFARGTRVRLYADDGRLLADNWRRAATRRFTIADPAGDSWRRASAKWVDRLLEGAVSFRALAPYAETAPDTAARWPEIAQAQRSARAVTLLRRAADGDFVLTAAAPVTGGGTVHLTDSADDLTQVLRAERLTSAWLLTSVTALTLFLSLFLARTIVRPLRMLAIAAHRVRLGRSREVVVPRLPERSDEIGALARAISDMSIALRRQIDATEAFAADVAHELKNPLASLRSAVDVLETVERPELRERLLTVIRDDVGRIDRLISDIADASRLDAELSRTGFELVDAMALARGLVAAYGLSSQPRGVRLAFAGTDGSAFVHGDAGRLAQVLRGFIDNAISFSPDGGTVTLGVASDGDTVALSIADQGPGVPPANRADIFRRFYSERPEAEDFGRHSGLGLSIAASIIHAHGGRIEVDDAPGGGALFRALLPAA